MITMKRMNVVREVDSEAKALLLEARGYTRVVTTEQSAENGVAAGKDPADKKAGSKKTDGKKSEKKDDSVDAKEDSAKTAEDSAKTAESSAVTADPPASVPDATPDGQ